jgi:para-aminobenzoate synthetase/4-amino-4-deoxychorismate lyase
MIVDMVRNDLGRVAAVGSVEVPRLFEVEQYPTLWQMTSTVCARTHESLDAILAATFPPASITGAPKRRTMEIIAELESSPRRVYTGAIGVLSPGRRARFNVAIRTVLVHRASGRAEYGVGGGIVWDSTPAGEYAECATKARVLAHRPRDFDLLETLLWTGSGGYAYLSEHLRRLERSAAYFGFELDPVRVRRELDSLGRGLGIGPARVRLTVSPSGAVRAEARAWSTGSASGFGTVSLAAHAIDPSNVFLYHKTTNRQVYSEALQARPGSDDVLLWNSRGEVTESTVANVAVELDGVLCTPPLSSGLLPGTMRAWMLARGCLRERVLRVEDVLGDAPVYLFNSVRGMHRVQVRTNGSA